MDGKVNTWNVRSYAAKNQPPANFNFKRNCNPGKVIIWAGLFGRCQIVGPYFFEGNVNGNSYLAMPNEFVVPKILEINWEKGIMVVLREARTSTKATLWKSNYCTRP